MSRWTEWADMLWYTGIPTKGHVALALRDMYIAGLKQGYSDADHDFHSANLPNGEPDECPIADLERLLRGAP